MSSLDLTSSRAMEAKAKLLLLLLEFVLLVSLLIRCVPAQQLPLSSAIERSSLLDLRSSLGLRGRDWPIKADPCLSWKGVQCENGVVTGVNVSGLRRTRVGRFNPRFSVDSLANLTRLTSFNASGFYLPGSIPDWFGSRLPALQVLDLGSSSVFGSIPGSLGNLSRLSFLCLSGNNLAGALPAALLSMPNLRFLDLSGNNFTGFFPSLTSSGNDTGAVFNLSNNMLYGDLNSSFRQFSLIDLSSNYFQGRVADYNGRNVTLDGNCLQAVENQRSSNDCRLFYAKIGLSFDNFGDLGPTQPPWLESEAKSSRKWIFILVGVLGGIAFIVILVFMLVLILRRCDKGIAKQRGSANVGPVPEGDSTPPPKDPSIVSGVGDSFTYEQLLHATGNFSETNLIKHGHSGDLFKGVLESGIAVVVKKFNLHSLKKESYMTELDLFSKVSHARLVPFLGQCLEPETQKLLVYKFMVCGDLVSSLHRVTVLEDDSLQSLDWITRLKIAIGAAEGLSYLHHECNPPLVHRDVQASSILLDDKFEVRLGSLSEVRAQEGDSNQNVLTRLLRRQASESGLSGSSPATCAHDVYCFGKVLLELVTGKLGISKADDATTREWLENTLPYISIYDKEMVSKIVDPSLIVDEDLLEEVWAMAIVARSCLNPKPSRRPPMKYILKALENPFKVVREESFSSARLRTTSSRRSWSTAFFGSWRQSSSESATLPGHTNREFISSLKQSGRVGSHGIEHSSSNKRLSNEIFPEPVEIQDIERQD
ncbi:hypothetical protein JRO89_XS07G0040500 [Xanthoceras sorbifolium]|uniref:Protein kinase domain-containing protein n=1 Tax=Xanthoceras sorbifolium TaxID=99658 RepID=A0ABQ8HSJ3_9ROSI|nr:hypothetical protein JRO89_XS07G0040500 [Xanthoceras sorbifolium]